MWRMLAKLIWAYDILPAVDPQTGEPAVLDVDDCFDGVLRFPKPFKVQFKARNAKRESIIRQSFKEAEQFIARWE
jgi:hypothetical protein